MSAVSASPSQYVLQYLLSGRALHPQLGCAHLSFVSWLSMAVVSLLHV